MHTAIDKLRQLRTLHEDGLLSRQEFDSRKNAILDAEYAPQQRAAALGLRAEAAVPLLAAGQQLGLPNRRYRLERLVANGGSGQVWQATDLATQAELGGSALVALNILPPSFTCQVRHARLLIEQATQARRLAHEHIVRVYEWSRDPASAGYFIIMECLDGESLDSLLARAGPMPLERALQMLAPLADALEYAWDKHQMVHRDIQPCNVLITGAGTLKLLDFGIATRVRSRAGDPGAQARPAFDTEAYRAPEAGVRQRPPGRTLDVYAVAVMLCKMVAGTLPFGGARAAGDVPARPPAIGEREWAVLQSGFAWQPQARPVSVATLLEQLGGAAAPVAKHVKAAWADQAAQQTREQQAQQCDAAAQAAAARAASERLRSELEARVRASAEAARLARKETLLQQLRERRAADAEQARLAQADLARKAMRARAAAAYRAEQERVAAAAEECGTPAPHGPPLAASASAAAGDGGAVLHDRFLDGSGSAPELVVVPAGRFQMGSSAGEQAIAIEAGAEPAWIERESPQHWVAIGQPFGLGRYPVTVGEWRQFVRATGWQPHGKVAWDAPGFDQDDEHPVVGVTWEDAQLYLRWLSAQTGHAYRLPSEAEWEYACRAGSASAFSFGERIDTGLANYDGNYSYNGSPQGECRHGTTWVGQFAPNPWGLFDMHGNVWEWVQDAVHDSYEGAPLDGSAWEEGGDQGRRVLRGGSWLYSPRYLRSALRNGFSAALGNDIVGFRVARQLGGAPVLL